MHAIKNAVRAHRGLYGHRMEGFYDAFDHIDKDGDGTISRIELAEALHRLDIGLTESQIVELVHVADVDGDGNIDFDEFCRVLGLTRREKKKEDMVRRKRKERRTRSQKLEANNSDNKSLPRSRIQLESPRLRELSRMLREKSVESAVAGGKEDEEEELGHYATTRTKRETVAAAPSPPPPSLMEAPRRVFSDNDECIDEQENRERSNGERFREMEDERRRVEANKKVIRASTSFPPPPPPSPTHAFLLQNYSDQDRERYSKALARIVIENATLLDTLRRVVADDLGSYPYLLERLDQAVYGSDQARNAIGRGGGSTEMLRRIESMMATRTESIFMVRTLKEIELVAAKARREERLKYRRVLAQAVERSTRAECEIDILREALRDKKERNIATDAKAVSRRGTRALLRTGETRLKSKALSKNEGGEGGSARSRRRPRRHRRSPTHITLHFPEDWDGAGIEISVSEDESEFDECDEEMGGGRAHDDGDDDEGRLVVHEESSLPPSVPSFLSGRDGAGR